MSERESLVTRIQSLLSDLTVDADGDIMGVSSASYKIADLLLSTEPLAQEGGVGEDKLRYFIEYDGFVGTEIGSYVHLDGKPGVVLIYRSKLEDKVKSWECKDYADGWISFANLTEALAYQFETGCIMRPVRTAVQK